MEKKSQVVVISLDAVDLSLLPIYQIHSDGGTAPLWSLSHLDKRRNVYYEFVIKNDDTKEDVSEPVIKHVTCHICDINVPEVYFNEHKNGFRHKFNRKVTDIALKRLQMYVDKDYINENNERLSSKYFCVECSIVINSEDEMSHKQTTAHRNSVLIEKFFNDFLIIYTRDDSEAVDNKSKDVTTEPIYTRIKSKNCEQEYISDESNTEETLTINSCTNSDEQKSIIETVTNITKEKEESVKEDVRETKEDKRTEDDITKTNSMYDLRRRKIVSVADDNKHIKTEPVKEIENSDQDFVSATNIKDELTTNPVLNSDDENKTLLNLDKLNNNVQSSTDIGLEDTFIDICHGRNIYKFKLAKQSYNSIVDTGATSYICMICNQMFVREDLSTHIDSALHEQNLNLKPVDRDCIRKINSSQYNCVLCDEYFKEYELHVNSDTHLTNFRRKLISKRMNKAKDNICNEDKKYDNSEECDVISNGNNSSTDTNKNRVNEITDSITPSTSSFVTEDTDNIVKIETNEYYCNICKVKVPSFEGNVIEHNNGRLHMSNAAKQTEINDVTADKVNEINENKSSADVHPKTFCQICNTWISLKHLGRHKKTKKHFFNSISDYNYLLQYLDNDNFSCKICKVSVSQTVNEIKEHFISSKHVNNYNRLLRTQAILVVSKKKLYCTQCAEYILDKNEYLHIESKEHIDAINCID